MPEIIKIKKRYLSVRGMFWGGRTEFSYIYRLSENEVIENNKQLLLKAGDFESVTSAEIIEENHTIETTKKSLKKLIK